MSDLATTIADYAALITAESTPTPDGWRITVTANGQSVTFEYDYPDGFTRQQLTNAGIVSALWGMTACARGDLRRFARLMGVKHGEPMDDDLKAQYNEWWRIGVECQAMFGEDFGIGRGDETDHS